MHRDPPVSRRTFLKRAAVTGGVVVAAGAAAVGIDTLLSGGDGEPGATTPPTGGRTSSGTSGGRTTTPPSSPASSPTTSPLVVDTRWPIKHVVYVMLENRSFNHMFGAFPGATDTTRIGVADGREVPLTVAPEWFPGDLPHARPAGLQDVNGGKMDGFTGYDVATIDSAMTINERDTVANWWHWAERFVLCDHVFASANTASYPNHLYMIAGTSGGAFDNPIQGQKALQERKDKGLAKTWGCDAPEGAKLILQDYETGEILDKNARPCFTFDTQGQQLSRKDIDWAFYAANERQTGYIWSAYTAVDGVFNTHLWDEH